MESVTFDGCYNTGRMYAYGSSGATSYIGSFIGKIYDNTTFANPTVTIKNSYTTGVATTNFASTDACPSTIPPTIEKAVPMLAGIF